MANRMKDFFDRTVGKWNPFNKQTDDAEFRLLRERKPEHPSSGLTVQKLASIFKDAENGNLMAQCDFATDIEEKDAHVFAELSKRKRGLLNVGWSIKPPRNASDAEIKDAQMIQDAFEDGGWLDNAILDMGDGILKGFSNLEIDWDNVQGIHVPSRLIHRDPSWFQLNPDNQNEMRLRSKNPKGDELRPFGWVQHQHKAKSGYLGRAGLIRCLAWPYLFKNLSVRDLAEFLEIYGIPTKLGKYPSGASDAEKRSLMRAVTSLGHNAGGIMPAGMDIDFQAAAAGSADSFMTMINWCERNQSKVILGGTLTSQADGKSSTNALGNVHNEVRQELRESDLKQIQETITRDIVYPMYVLNGKTYKGGKHRIPQFEFDLTEPEDITVYAQNLGSLVDMGMRIKTEWAHEKLQIPLAEKDDDILKPTTSALSNATTTTALKGLKSALKPNVKDTTEQHIELLETKTGEAVGEWVDQVRELVNQVDSLEELTDSILTLLPDMDKSQFGNVMAEAMLAAQMAGRFDIMEDA